MEKSARTYIPGICLFIGGLAAYDEHPNNTVPNARRVHAIMSQNEQPTEWPSVKQIYIIEINIHRSYADPINIWLSFY